MGEARRRKTAGVNPSEKIPKTFLWSRAFLRDELDPQFEAACQAAKRAGFPAPSEDGFVQALVRAGIKKMADDMAAMRTAREKKLIVTPHSITTRVPGEVLPPL